MVMLLAGMERANCIRGLRNGTLPDSLLAQYPKEVIHLRQSPLLT
jgi:hypothetical protein